MHWVLLGAPMEHSGKIKHLHQIYISNEWQIAATQLIELSVASLSMHTCTTVNKPLNIMCNYSLLLLCDSLEFSK